jgi:hypothetical protein
MTIPLWVPVLKSGRQPETIMCPRPRHYFYTRIAAVDCSLHNYFWALRHVKVRIEVSSRGTKCDLLTLLQLCCNVLYS